MVYIYILKLTENKYYIGKTATPEFRIESHFNFNGSAWTKKYKPIEIIELLENCDNYDEDKYTLKYMSKFGINNVRGGSFCEVNLSSENIVTIKKMIDSTTDSCYICGESGHFANKCDKDFNQIYNELETLLVDNDLCFRCYRKGHYAHECYARKTATGRDIEDDYIEEFVEIFYCEYCNKEFETEKGAKYHENFYCKKNPKKNIKIQVQVQDPIIKNIKKEEKIQDKQCNCATSYFSPHRVSKCLLNNVFTSNINTKTNVSAKTNNNINLNKNVTNKCHRCGREGHYADNCYATKHINGKYLN